MSNLVETSTVDQFNGFHPFGDLLPKFDNMDDTKLVDLQGAIPSPRNREDPRAYHVTSTWALVEGERSTDVRRATSFVHRHWPPFCLSN
jgi:hypothetical protein